MPSSAELTVDQATGSTVSFTRGDASVTFARPIIVSVLGGNTSVQQYDSLTPDADGTIVGTASITLDEGSAITVEDRYESGSPTHTRLVRRVNIERVGQGEGIQVRLEADVFSPGAQAAAWQYFLPCTLYNRNDSDGDGIDDYLGTFSQDLRDDKNGALAALVWDQNARTAFSIARTDVPDFDTAITPEEVASRAFVQRTDIGSLGFAPLADERAVLRASYPFKEESSFSVDMAGSGWEAFLPLKVGTAIEVAYEFRIDQAPDYTEAIWGLFNRQKALLGTRRPTPDVSLEESVELRQLLTQLNYRKWSAEENPKEPAGYLVHFSPRTGDVQGSLIEFGFSGDQTLVAWAQLEWGYRSDVELYKGRARSVFDFFVDHCQLDNGFAQGIYDPINDRFTYWFTGILMPFQYADDEEDVRHYIGSQMTQALMPIARELRKKEGNYMRTMCESFYPLLLAYGLDQANGVVNDRWLDAGKRFGEFLLATQSDDGSWYRAYEPTGEGLTNPAAWFGGSYIEQKSGTIFPIPVLTTLHTITGDERFLEAARRAGDFLVTSYVEPTIYIGGLNDTTHIKSVKTDAVGIMFLMRSLLKLHEATGEANYLYAAVKAAKVLSTWVYLWDVPMPEDTTLGRAGFKSTGWAGCDVIASGSYLDDEFLEFTVDLVRVAELSGEEELFDVAELVEFGMQYALSTPRNDHGYVAPGIQCEGLMTGYWVSAPDETAFSGAVNKLKGDDNDTCNALINAQAAYGIYGIEATYQTLDFDSLRLRLFSN